MTVQEYLNGRAAFDGKKVKRDPAVAVKARTLHQKDLIKKLTEDFAQEGFSSEAAEQEAVKAATQQMSTLAALHNPDMKAAGSDVITDFGDRNVNSRIGAQWGAGTQSRLQDLDDAALAVPEPVRSTAKMNAKLKRCK